MPTNPLDDPDTLAAYRAFAVWADANKSANDRTFEGALRQRVARRFADMRESVILFGYASDCARLIAESLHEPLLLLAAMPEIRDRRDEHKHNLMHRYRPGTRHAGRRGWG